MAAHVTLCRGTMTIYIAVTLVEVGCEWAYSLCCLSDSDAYIATYQHTCSNVKYYGFHKMLSDVLMKFMYRF